MPPKPSDGTSTLAVGTRRIDRTSPKADDGTLTSRLIERVMARMDLAFTSSFAATLRGQLVGRLIVDRLVTTRFCMDGEALQQGLMAAAVQRL